MGETSAQKFCTRCGGALPAGSAFCPSCGRSLGNSKKAGRSAETAAARGPEAGASSAGATGGQARPRSEPAPEPAAAGGRAAAIAVVAGFVAVGVAASIFLGRQGERTRAVTGSPGAASATGGEPRATGLPAEIKEKIDAALAELAEKARAEPESVETWRNLARARSRAAQFDSSYTASAEQALDRLLELAPDDLEAVRMYGNLDYVRGDFAGAEAYYKRYLKARPEDANVRTDLGSVTMFQGRREEAEAIFGRVLADHPDFMQAHFHLGVALHTAGDREHAVAHLERAMELADDDDRERIRPYLEAARSGAPHGQFAAGGAAATATRAAGTSVASATGSAAARAAGHASSNASSEFQRKVDALLLAHAILGPKISSIRWSEAGKARVALDQFPMDRMPAVMRNKFKSTMNERIAEIAAATGIALPVEVELVDASKDRVMDRFDGKEWVGAFDEQDDG